MGSTCSGNSNGASNSSSTSGPVGGVGDSANIDAAEMVEVVVGNVRMKYPTCYVLVCDADNSVNSPAFSQLAALEGGS